MATLSEMQVEVVEEIGSINVTDDATKINRHLNRGVRHVLRQTRCYQTSQSVTPGASANYTLASSVLSVIDMYFVVGNESQLLNRVTVPELNRMRAMSASTASPASHYAMAGASTVMFWPTPSASDSLTMIYVPVPTALSGASDDPSSASLGGIPVDYHELIVWYACWQLARFDDDASSDYGQKYKDQLDEGIKRAKRELAEKGGEIIPRSVLGPRHRRFRRANDIYPSW